MSSDSKIKLEDQEYFFLNYKLREEEVDPLLKNNLNTSKSGILFTYNHNNLKEKWFLLTDKDLFCDNTKFKNKLAKENTVLKSVEIT